MASGPSPPSESNGVGVAGGGPPVLHRGLEALSLHGSYPIVFLRLPAPISSSPASISLHLCLHLPPFPPSFSSLSLTLIFICGIFGCHGKPKKEVSVPFKTSAFFPPPSLPPAVPSLSVSPPLLSLPPPSPFASTGEDLGEELLLPELGQDLRPIATAAATTAAVGTSLRPGREQSLAGQRGPLCPQAAGKDKVLPERVSVDGGEPGSHDLALPTRDVGQPLPTVCPFLPCPTLPPAAGTPTCPSSASLPQGPGGSW